MRVLTSTITLTTTAALLVLSTLPFISCNRTPSLQLQPQARGPGNSGPGSGGQCWSTSTCTGVANYSIPVGKTFSGCAAVSVASGHKICSGCTYSKANCREGGACVNMQGNRNDYDCIVCKWKIWHKCNATYEYRLTCCESAIHCTLQDKDHRMYFDCANSYYLCPHQSLPLLPFNGAHVCAHFWSMPSSAVPLCFILCVPIRIPLLCDPTRQFDIWMLDKSVDCSVLHWYGHEYTHTNEDARRPGRAVPCRI